MAMVPLAPSPATVISIPVARAGPAANARTALSSLCICGHLDADHPVRFGRWLAACNRIHMLHALNHAAIDSVLPVEEVVVGKVDKELAVGAVRVGRPGRAQRATIMGQFGELGRNVRLVRPTGARHADIEPVIHVTMFHVARLRHEAVDDPVERHVVIFTCAREFLHPLGVLGCHILVKLNGDGAAFEFYQDRVFGVFDLGHVWYSLIWVWALTYAERRQGTSDPSPFAAHMTNSAKAAAH
mmetsp:Transcript_29037/g.55781  ORF Transcript_29037/g.55781 Transcript_29037/m.55781 type:complete len:242 (-) Transcript_29037:5512-6237(-)